MIACWVLTMGMAVFAAAIWRQEPLLALAAVLLWISGLLLREGRWTR